MYKNEYTVIVGNVGQVYEGHNKCAALKEYNAYVRISKAGKGRAGNEDVTLYVNGEPEKEHTV